MQTKVRKILFALIFIVPLCAIFIPARKAGADSVLGSGHFGIPVLPADARSRAIGGASVALPGEVFSFTNPARTINFRRSGFNGVIAQDYRTVKGPYSTDKLRSTEFLAFRAVFPTAKRFVVSWGIFQSRDLEWVADDRIDLPFSTGELQRYYSSDGGIYVSRIGVARTLSPHLAVGLGLDWTLGKTRQRRNLNFGAAEYLNSTELFSYEYSCFRPTFGVLTGYRRFSLGFALTIPKTCTIDKQSTFSSGYTAKEIIGVDFPVALRIGTALNVSPRGLIAADLEFEEWSNLKGTLDPRLSPANQWRFCLGYELLPASGDQRAFYRKVPLRVGYSRSAYPFKIDGEPVGEQLFSFGTGLYFGQGGGLMDLAFEIGKRKAIAPGLPDESLFRVIVSLSAFERWVSKPRRK